jgi:pyridoxal phosphate enzyme (YggS family)
MPTVDPGLVAERLAAVHERIRSAGGHDVQVVAVTKTFGADAIVAAVAAGCGRIGENYAQELVAKLRQLPGDVRPEVHFIGHLQSNKVKLLAPWVHVWQTVDRPSVVAELGRRVPGARVLVQVNTTDEPSKGGCAPGEVHDLVASARAAGLHVEGLMTIGPTEGGPEAARPAFRLLRVLAAELDLTTLSMGMTHDLEVAVEEGATMVRVGTALFGPRPRIV